MRFNIVTFELSIQAFLHNKKPAKIGKKHKRGKPRIAVQIEMSLWPDSHVDALSIDAGSLYRFPFGDFIIESISHLNKIIRLKSVYRSLILKEFGIGLPGGIIEGNIIARTFSEGSNINN